MCIIFASEEGYLPNKTRLKVAFENNPHGTGFMWLDNGVVRTLKGLMSFSEVWGILKLLEDKPYSCHFRYRTRGKIGRSNCHPFKVQTADGSAWLMHNGTLFNVHVSNGMSDTQVFSRHLSVALSESRDGFNRLHDDKFLVSLGDTVESFNKLVFMTPHGMSFANRNARGTFEEDGIWYSNDYSFIKGYRTKSKTPSPELNPRISTRPPKETKETFAQKVHVRSTNSTIYISSVDESRLNYLLDNSDDLASPQHT